MTSKEIMEKLLEGRKVGDLKDGYMYLNIDGDLCCEMLSGDFYFESHLIGYLWYSAECKVLAEEGP